MQSSLNLINSLLLTISQIHREPGWELGGGRGWHFIQPGLTQSWKGQNSHSTADFKKKKSVIYSIVISHHFLSKRGMFIRHNKNRKYFDSKNNENGWQTFLFHIQGSLWVGVVLTVSFFLHKIQNNTNIYHVLNYRPTY